MPRLDEDVHLVAGVGQPAKQRLAQDHVAQAVEGEHQAAAGPGEAGRCAHHQRSLARRMPLFRAKQRSV